MPGSLADYEVISVIGSGSYGTCKKIRRKRDGRVLVWKEMDYGEMSETEKQMLVSEVNLLRELKHRHIVRYYDRIVDRANTCLYIIMEYCEGGDLASYIKGLKINGGHAEEDFAWKICTQTISALKECHDRSKLGKTVLHRDLKPANVFLDSNNNVKLGDFGLARVLNHDTSFAKTFVGTPYYMSPEQMSYMSYNEKSDIWSLGCLLYELCALRPPFTASNQKDLASKITNGTFARLPLRYSADLNSIIAYMLQVEESKRPSIDDLIQHPLIVKRSSSTSGGRRSESSSRDERSSDSLRKMVEERESKLLEREKELEDKERRLALKEKEIAAREKTVTLREKIAEERMSRAEKLMKEYTEAQLHLPRRLSGISIGERDFASDSDLSVLSPDVPVAPQQISQRPSCLVRDQRPLDSPSKRVSFSVANKENILASNSSNEINGKPQRPSKKCLLNLEEKFNNADRLSDVERRAALFRYPFVKP